MTTHQRIDLQSFCAKPNEYRTWMHKPFRVGAWLYATNGHYAVRVPATDEPEASVFSKNIGSLFASAFSDAEDMMLMPDFRKAPTCLKCQGSGIKPDPDFDTDYDECDECLGRGFQKWLRTRIGNAEYELGYLNKMAELPQARIFPNGPNRPMAILFDGGQALLMPMIPENAK